MGCDCAKRGAGVAGEFLVAMGAGHRHDNANGHASPYEMGHLLQIAAAISSRWGSCDCSAGMRLLAPRQPNARARSPWLKQAPPMLALQPLFTARATQLRFHGRSQPRCLSTVHTPSLGSRQTPLLVFDYTSCASSA